MKKSVVLLLLVVFGCLAGVILLELVARLLPPPASRYTNYGDAYVCSPSVGWLGRPEYEGLLTREEYSHPIRFNTSGMYDTEHSIDKADDVFRILWVGDSFAQTLQVGEAQTAHQQLEYMLNERLGGAGQSFEVINSGVIGWSTGQELVYYREQGRLFRPDLVLLLFFVGNDVNDNLPGHALTIDGFNCFAPYFPICDGQLDPYPWYYIPGLKPGWDSCSVAGKWLAAGLSSIQRNSYLFARIEPLLLLRSERRTYGQEFGLPFAALYLPEESPEVAYGWQVAEELLTQFATEAAAEETQFAVVIVGPREVVWLAQLSAAQLQTFYESAPIFAKADIDQPNQRLSTFLQEHDIPVLDLQQPMIDHIAETGTQLYLPIDRHWTVEGNRLAAELVYRWLVENSLLLDQANGR